MPVRLGPHAGRSRHRAKEKQRKTEKTQVERRARMGIDGGDYSRSGKRGIGFGSHVCRAGFLCETARGDFRVGDSIENGARQSRAPLRAVARTRASAERPVSLDGASAEAASTSAKPTTTLQKNKPPAHINVSIPDPRLLLRRLKPSRLASG